jgi:diadenylate cyclase
MVVYRLNPIDKVLSEFRISDFNIPTVQFIDIVDIFIVAFLIYTLVLWIKETRAWSLFKGILIILLFSVFAIVFKLNTILWILSNTLSVGIMAIIVVFQPEMRKALEQLGKTHLKLALFDTQTVNLSTSTTDEIVKAAEKMAAVRTGALILIEREVGLGDHERTGIPIDAIVTSQLLINIFEDKTPLHDGAVIIRNNRIAAATCFLPLTESQDLSKDLGTRHRAAVGVSEVSDALVIVVSEETGAISVAIGGKLKRNISGEKLKSMINEDSQENKKKLVLWKGRKHDD